MRKALLLFLLALPVYAHEFSADDKITVTFSPSGGTTQAIVSLIDSAQTSIYMLAYNFTSREIGKALVRAHQRGVDVNVIVDKSMPCERGSVQQILREGKISLYVDRKHHIAHNKVIIVDEKIVEMGSFNYTDSAERNNGENAVIIPTVSGARIFLDDWKVHQSHSLLMTEEPSCRR